MGKKKSNGQFRFHKNDSIGSPAAEEDLEYLDVCFVDTGDLEVLLDPLSSKVIILGRTGTGKTALIKRLVSSTNGRAIVIEPENLALTYISNSTILKFFAELGINLDPFYKLLWRHVFTVEILNQFFDEKSQEQPESIFDRLRALFKGSSREDKELQQAVEYLEQWGKTFWKETEYRVREITSKVEKDLEQTISATIGIEFLKAGAERLKADRLSDEQRVEVVNRAQDVVAQAQVKDLHQVFNLLGKVLTNDQKVYYIVIDHLDENWVEERLRYKLIMGLILTAKEFFKGVRNAKILIALRRDLIERVFRLTRESGFQEEKYAGNYLRLLWAKEDILSVLDTRVRQLVRRRYTKQPVSYIDLLPADHKGKSIGEYIYSIAKTPRDVIALFNACIQVAVDKPRLGTREFTLAMGEYSRSRLRALANEWQADHPHLLDFAAVLRGRPNSFKAAQITRDDVEELCLQIVVANSDGKDSLHHAANSVVDELMSFKDFRVQMLLIFYRTGLIGLKASSDMPASWVDDSGEPVTRGQVDKETSVVVAPKYATALGVRA